MDQLVWIDWGAIGFACLAAILWVSSAFIRPPRVMNVFHTTGLISYSPELTLMARALRTQSLFNAAAALCAGLSAGLVAAKLFLEM